MRERGRRDAAAHQRHAAVDADLEDDGRERISDPVYLLRYLLLGGPPPPPPFGACGADPTEDDLECALDAACR
ncbi:MAG: hypothetical protein JXA90_07020 [Planctomycetes bacterium]|nr:hypothetical protein [Planctomycetota bacterium]